MQSTNFLQILYNLDKSTSCKSDLIESNTNLIRILYVILYVVEPKLLTIQLISRTS